jgi:hypothetical protein
VTRLTDDELIEAIYEEAQQAAIDAWGPGGATASCPYASDSKEAEIWMLSEMPMLEKTDISHKLGETRRRRRTK